jgi:hypothetical protein
MKKYRKLINNNLQHGDCGLWFNVVANGISHVCPFSECKTWNDAIVYYFKHFHKPWKTIWVIQYHKISKNQLTQLALAC